MICASRPKPKMKRTTLGKVSMRIRVLISFLFLGLVLATSPARAQYMYLDANGDGIHTQADELAPTGSTVVDVWLHTDQNQDGTPASCSTGDGDLAINSYEFILHAAGGSVSWAGFTNYQPAFTISFEQASSAFDYHNGLGGSNYLSPGLYRLARISITVLSGSPSIQIARATPLKASYGTSFGSPCSGKDFDNTLKLGSDWFGVDGLPYGGPGQRPPSWGSIQSMSVPEGGLADQVVSASDPDGDPITFSKAAGPGFMTVTTLSHGTGTGTANIHLAPGGRDGGNYSGGVRASDGLYQADALFGIHVEVVRSPIDLPPLADVTMAQHGYVRIPIQATSPDADAIQYSLAQGPDYITVSNSSSLAGLIELRPNLRADVGSSSGLVVAQDEVADDSESISISVTPNFLPPGITFDPGVVQIYTEKLILVSVSDPDGDDIASLDFDRTGLPAADAVSFASTVGPGVKASGLLTWTPSALATYTLRFTATDAFGASATAQKDVRVHSRTPIISAPSVVRATPFAQVAIHVTVSDPDGDPIQDLNAGLGLAEYDGATFEEDPTHTSGTFLWTPTTKFLYVAGSSPFEVSFYASDGDLISSATTIIYLSYIDLDHVDANSLDLLVGNSGQVGFDIDHGRPGLIYPKGTQRTILYAMGPWIGGIEGGSLRVSRGGVNTECLPGTMTGSGPTPFDPRFRNYQITRADLGSGDYLSWPVGDGAPLDSGGKPRLQGDQMVWSVYNDFGQRGRVGGGWEYDTGTAPAGLEVRQTTFAFSAPGPLASIDFVRFVVTNHSEALMDSAHVAIWADPDVGSPLDDLAGSDPELGIGYVYNAPGTDGQYGDAPPAFGLAILDRPSTPASAVAQATAFTTYTPDLLRGRGLTPPSSFVMMQGKNPDGSLMRESDDPSRPPISFRYDGDPVAGTGWLDTTPGDKRIILSLGPFVIEPGETKEYVAGILVGQGANRLASVQALRDLVPIARYVAASNYTLLPYIHAPQEMTVAEGSPLSMTVDALDLDGGALTSVTADISTLPLGNNAHFEPRLGATGGTLTWTPGYSDAGTYEVRFVASNERSVTFSTTIHVLNTNRAPVADAGGPYAAVVGKAVECTASGSSDPDGDELAFAWSFGDGIEGSGAVVQHTYQTGGSFKIVLRASDGILCATDSTTAEIASLVQARAYSSQGQATIRLTSARPLYCFQLEPTAGSFTLADVDINSVRLTSIGTGSIQEAPATTDKTSAIVDRDNNGIEELTVCFKRDDLRGLFDALPAGEHVVDAAIEGFLVTGAYFRAPLSLRIIASSGLASSIAPNPMNPEATLTFRITRAGPVKVRILDVQGKSIHVVHDGPLDAGYHDLRISARTPEGRQLASGVYFYVIEAPEGIEKGRVLILK